ncbi:PorP/SprF family type IX secretion system membrane protein [Aquirufa sp. KTFRIE-69F]|uniref:PorP/SprF family type IX secretion system membrane protein n=1 Tax=Aquirufa originis TaxID=3096514 RepID=A0ABW6D209_9BACT
MKWCFSLPVGAFFLFIATASFAQQSPQFSIFSANSNIVNPAFSGWKSNNYVALQIRDQWTGYTTSNDGSGTLGTTWLSGSFGISPKGGLGVQFYSDKTPSGVSQQLIQFQGAYHLSKGNGVWSFGLSLGLQTKSFDGRVFRVRDPNDPLATLLSGSAVSQTQPDFGLGAVYSTDTWQIGFTADHLTAPTFDFNGGTASMPLDRVFALHGSAEVPLSDYFDLLPYALVRYYSGQIVPEGGARVYYNKLIYAGAAYRNADAAMGLVGVSVLQNKLDIGYAIDITTANSLNKKPLSHEVFLRFRIPERTIRQKPAPIRTPRFRIL